MIVSESIKAQPAGSPREGERRPRQHLQAPRRRFFRLLFPLILSFIAVCSTLPVRDAPAAAVPQAVHHDLKVRLYPGEKRLTAEDSITFRDGLPQAFQFYLHRGLSVSSPTPGVIVAAEAKTGGPAKSYKVRLPSGLKTFLLVYSGSVDHPVEPNGREQARGFSQTPGIISEEGVYLAGSSFWYPVSDAGLVSFNLRTELPSGWDAVSQGERIVHEKGKDKTLVGWESLESQEEIYLVAGRFTEYSQPGRISAMVFLRGPDKELAHKYLEATGRYISMYEQLIGPYPYKKFALVENFWETGFGMPSFTLLGPKVIRFPFIIDSSYPHEILHNWWGNSVFPDYAGGNWSEGLTAYLSDHLIKEQQGGGVEYRQTTLQKYADYVRSGRDFPLTEFRSRHSAPTEAVGYGKALMFFHMLRQEVGDRNFVAGLRDFYRANKFRNASFGEIRRSFEAVSGRDLTDLFGRWIERPGAPELRLGRAKSKAEKGGYILTAVIEQTQPGAAYHLQIRVAVTLEGNEKAYQTVVRMDRKRLELELSLPSRPMRIDVDPEFDVFRRLHRDELPPAISGTLGAGKMLIILPSSAAPEMLKAYEGFAKSLGDAGPDSVEVRRDKELKKLPSDRAVVVLGWENRFLDVVESALSGYAVSVSRENVRIEKTVLPKEGHALVFAARNPENKEMGVLFAASALPGALPGLGRKLPHYHKYSYLGFEGEEPVNVAKGRWPVLVSPMTAFMPGAAKVERGKLAARDPLAALPQVFSQERMMEVVRFLSQDELKGRGFGTEGLDRAAEYIAEKFREAGLEPAGDDRKTYFQTWEDRGGDPERRALMKNVVGVIPGNNPGLSGQSIVLGAHYDHLGLGWPDVKGENRGKVHPGADDNASGVAVLIELARVLVKSLSPARSIVFAAFTGEEAGRRGSKYFIEKQTGYPSGLGIGMLNLDTVGRLDRKKLLILGAGSAGEWVHIFRGAGYVSGVEVEMVSEQLDSSDHVSFHEAGVPAVQIFTGPHPDYHQPADTPDKIDPEGLVKVARVTKEVVEYLAGREAPLTSAVKAGDKAGQGPKSARRASIGTIPDFAYKGRGYRISGVAPGSPADVSGLREGDVIIRINSGEVNGLKDLSDILKSLSPGDRIRITFLREGEELSVETAVAER